VAQFRSDAIDALVSATKLNPSGPLVESRTRELLRGLAQQVEARGIPLETYLAMTGQTPEALIGRLEDEARQSVARELVLEAAADKLAIVVSDDDVEALVREQAELLDEDAEETLAACARAAASRRCARTCGCAMHSTASSPR